MTYLDQGELYARFLLGDPEAAVVVESMARRECGAQGAGRWAERERGTFPGVAQSFGHWYVVTSHSDPYADAYEEFRVLCGCEPAPANDQGDD